MCGVFLFFSSTIKQSTIQQHTNNQHIKQFKTSSSLLIILFIKNLKKLLLFKTAVIFLRRVRALPRLIGNAVKISDYTRSCEFHKKHFLPKSLPFFMVGRRWKWEQARRPTPTHKPNQLVAFGIKSNDGGFVPSNDSQSLFLTFLIQTDGRFVHY